MKTGWWQNRWAYASLVLALMLPGVRPYELPSQPVNIGKLERWSATELELLINEGRRQFDRQVHNMDTLRARSQWLFTVGLALLAALIGASEPFQIRAPTILDIVLSIGLISTIYSALGAAALIVVAAQRGVIETAAFSNNLSSQADSITKQLAMEYAQALQPGERVWRTRLTVFFEAAIWLLIAAGCASLVYLLQ